MILLKTIWETIEQLLSCIKEGKSIGFVPTMGALHDGHLSLIKQSKAENDYTVCSIFVNPIQFNKKKDLDTYPRMVDQDSKLVEAAGCDLVFSPEPDEIYPEGKVEKLTLDFGMLDKVLEGKFRPGHFEGVAIVVKKLFDIIQPTKAYFGKKDYQQLVIIQSMVNQLQLPVQVIACETIREHDGLAMSSRNLRLTVGERVIAPNIFRILTYIKTNAGKKPVFELRQTGLQKLQEIRGFTPEYLDIVDKQTFMPVNTWDHAERIIACTAVYVGEIRLIDNIELFS